MHSACIPANPRLSLSSVSCFQSKSLRDLPAPLLTVSPTANLTPSQPVYVQHFKCNIRDIRSGYPHLHKWMRDLYWNNPAFKDTTNFLHIKVRYMITWSQSNSRPTRTT